MPCDAAADHGLAVSTEQVGLARIALKRPGLIGKGSERDCRPTESEVRALIAFFEADERQIIPVGRVGWTDVNERARMPPIRDRKNPRNKQGNDQRIPLFGPGEYYGWSIFAEQALYLGSARGRIFPCD